MKKIRLHGITFNEEDAKNEILTKTRMAACLLQEVDEIQAQLDAPEPVEFWEGQLCQFSDEPGFYMQAPVGVFLKTRIEEGVNKFVMAHGRGWRYCRPLQDPLILQFKAHKPGDPMPKMGEMDAVKVINSAGFITQGVAYDFDWSERRSPNYQIIGWMPAAGWEGGR